MMVERLKQEGTSHSSSDLLKINVKMDDSWTAQALRQAGETPSGCYYNKPIIISVIFTCALQQKYTEIETEVIKHQILN